MSPPEFETIDYSVDAGGAVITFIRPNKLNSFTTRMNLELVTAFDLSDADDDVQAVVVTGQGPAFCVGADLHEGFIGRGAALTEIQQEYVEAAGQSPLVTSSDLPGNIEIWPPRSGTS